MSRRQRLALLAAGVLLAGSAWLWTAVGSEAARELGTDLRERAVLVARGHGPGGDEARALRTLVGDAARHLETTSPTGAVVATFEGGLLAARLDRPILDLGGLADREVVEARRDGRLPEWVAERSPRYLLTVSRDTPPAAGSAPADRPALATHPLLRDHYRPVLYLTTTGGWRAVIHERHPLRFDVGLGAGGEPAP